MENSKYELTVICLTYNHEKYIAHTLEGFVSQKTNFKYEVIVHDDASTDNTRLIIEDYANRYPDIIKPIIQTENQFSKGVKIRRDIIRPRVKTKYIALCEGDDYWTNDKKLQIQYDYMEEHPACIACVHNTRTINESGEDLGETVNSCLEDRDYEVNEIIAAGGGRIYQTSSLLYRTEAGDNMPDVYQIRGVGDYPLAIYLSTQGYIHYIAEVMSAYRKGTIGGWTNRMNSDRKKYANHMRSMGDYLKRLDEFTLNKYSVGFAQAISRYDYFALVYDEAVWKTLFKKRCMDVFKKEIPSAKTRFVMIVKDMVKSVLKVIGVRQ